MFDDSDDGAKVGLWTALGIVALLLFFLVGSLAYRQLHRASGPAAAGVATVTVAQEDILLDVPLTGELIEKVYFEVNEATISADAAARLQQVLARVPAGKRVMLSGFHDPSGDPVKNAELAANRARAVRAALVMSGLERPRAVLRKPAHAAQGGDAAEARRVEIRIVD